MLNGEMRKQLEGYQSKIEEAFDNYLTRDFDLKMDMQKSTADFLAERDALLMNLSQEELREFITGALENFPDLHPFLPIGAENGEEFYDCDFIKFIKAEYCEGYKIKVTVDLYENPYIEETKLERTFGFINKEDSAMQLKYKDGKEPCPLFTYFEADDEALEMFDLLHEFYTNMAFYALENVEDK